MTSNQPKYITYRGAKYERIPTLNEIRVDPTPGLTYTLFKNQDEPLSDHLLTFKGYITTPNQSRTALEAFKKWFDESGEKNKERVFGGHNEDGRETEDAEDFLENSGIEHEEDRMIELNGKTLKVDVLRNPVEIPTYFISYGKLSEKDINDIVYMGVYGVFDLIDGG